MRKINASNSSPDELVSLALGKALAEAEENYVKQSTSYSLSSRLKHALEDMSAQAQRASTGFTNILTCLAIKLAFPNADIRYHQVQIQGQTAHPAGFNFRGVSEKIVYPWICEHSFEGAKSGWQTRTFERPKPYMLDYDENIGDIKHSFLTIFDEIEEQKQDATEALVYLLHLQLQQRDSKKISLSIPKTNDISTIITILQEHFFHSYKASKGASRLPVLALHSIYSILVTQLDRFRGMQLKPLEEHSAADSQTGALGDIEVILKDGNVFEAIEIKHNIALSDAIIQSVRMKIMDKDVKRYYILTTHNQCEVNDKMRKQISQLESLYDCQIIANGVIDSIKYYLRLLTEPNLIFPVYVKHLANDKAIKHEHRSVWNKLTL